jgi:hypothetical protein
MERCGTTFRRRAAVFALSFAGLLLASGNIAARADGPITFDQVLTAPDDPEINLSFARQEANDGRLLNAAAALERILLAHPNAHSVRLFYAAVLYRLNDLQGAKRQLKLLEGVHLTPLQTAERDKYERLVEAGQSRNSVHGRIVTGIVVESDAIGALLERSELFFFGGHPKNGAAAIAGGDIEIDNDAGPNSDIGLFASVSIYTRSTFAGPNADFETGEFRMGISGSSLDNSWQVGPVVNHTLIFDQPYLTEYGGQGQFNWRYSTSATFTAGAEVVQQSFHEPSVDALVPFTIPGTHAGQRYTGYIGGLYRLDAYSTIAATVGYEGKSAGYNAFSYDSAYLNANYHALLGRGAYFDLQGDARYLLYRARDPVFLFIFTPPIAVQREDVRTDVRAALGAPLSALADEGATGDHRENLIFEGAVSFVDRTTRFPLAPFHSLGGEVRLVYKFGEGR